MRNEENLSVSFLERHINYHIKTILKQIMKAFLKHVH